MWSNLIEFHHCFCPEAPIDSPIVVIKLLEELVKKDMEKKYMKKNIEKYEEWIFLNYPTSELALLKCKEACKKMKEKFPELVIQRGQVEVPEQGNLHIRRKHEHCWCVLDDEIIDPTEHQYPTEISYLPMEEGKGEPTGRCINCGSLKYNIKFADFDDNNFCSKKCFDELTESMKREFNG